MLTLKIDPNVAKNLILGRISEMSKIRRSQNHGSNISDGFGWMSTTLTVMEGVYGCGDKHVEQLKGINPPVTGDEGVDMTNVLIMQNSLLRSYIDEINIFMATPAFQNIESNLDIDNIDYLERIFDKFHLIASRLKNRRKNKIPFQIINETDVQDLLLALMTPLFEDIRIDEPTSSFAGQYALIDFAIKDEKIAIETKIASDTHLEKDIGNELNNDIMRYKQDKKYSLLICFIYDPEIKLKNASVLKDLEKESTKEFEIWVEISPIR
jgi:hypothetical protein